MSARDSNFYERIAWRILAFAVSVLFLVFVVRPLMGPLVLATLAAVIFAPVHQRVQRRLGRRRTVGALISISLFGSLLAAPLAGFTVLFVAQAQGILLELAGEEEVRSRFVDLVRQYLDWFARLVAVVGDVDPQELAERAVRDLGSLLYERLPDVLGLVGELAFGALVVALTLFFLLLHGDELLALLVELSPLSETYSRRLLRRLTETIRAVFFGAVLTALFQGTVGGLGFLVTGFQNFVIWGVLVAAASFVPFVGTALVWAPAVVFLVLTGHSVAALVMLAFGAVISTVDNLLRALLIHERAAVHPLIVFLAIVGGFQTLGPMGLVYGPLLAAVGVEMIRIYRADFRRPPPPPAA